MPTGPFDSPLTTHLGGRRDWLEGNESLLSPSPEREGPPRGPAAPVSCMSVFALPLIVEDLFVLKKL